MSNETFQLFARTIRGIEWIASAEIEKRCHGQITEIRHREVRFRVATLQKALLALGSVDDIFLTVASWNDIDHTRAALSKLSKRASAIDFGAALKQLNLIRSVGAQPPFDVIASFLGRRNYNRYEIEDSVAEGITRSARWNYAPQRTELSIPIDVSFRIHLTDHEAIVGLRLTRAPLHRREYKISSRIGTLHPPLAFAMGLLSGADHHQCVLDPFCGVGTIPIELVKLDSTIQAFGLDIASESIQKAIVNAQSANVRVDFLVGDAAQLPLRDGVIDRVVSNPPWGQAVEVKGKLQAGPLPFFQEIQRVSRENAKMVLLIKWSEEYEESLGRADWRVLLRNPVSLFGSWTEIQLLQATWNEEPVFDETSVFGPTLKSSWTQHATRTVSQTP